MPIKYEVRGGGHFIYAKAHGTVTDKDFMDYELSFADDTRIKSPADELLEITTDAVMKVTREGLLEALHKRKEACRLGVRHRCAIVVNCTSVIAWDMAKFYESMAQMHSPMSVIVFASPDLARLWLGVSEQHV